MDNFWRIGNVLEKIDFVQGGLSAGTNSLMISKIANGWRAFGNRMRVKQAPNMMK
ncbi:hypothetical protein DMR_15000 [Solidesulfovibrio magneticus RS-1]|uniref:Uncharacterized protein n=1 Tax=Solidesulfovibrio magneticus (strain ATCC 700980 / DSM 13731 / RS-1) TaxID=573370 RepID=C4XNL6_SOLM1|nr:hypothetical protein DMR_15000 [Solidesulfovibrio magneticus RS-1]